MAYSSLLRDSWSIVWNQRWLWALGFLVALGGSGVPGLAFRLLLASLGLAPDASDALNLEPYYAEYTRRLPMALGGLSLLAVGLWLIQLWARAGLIGAAASLAGGETVTLGSALALSRATWGRMLGLELLLYAPYYLVVLTLSVLLIVLVAVFAPAGADDDRLAPFLLCLLPPFCLVFLWWLALLALRPLAQRAIVLQGLGVRAAIGIGGRLLRRYLVQVIGLGLLLGAFSLVFGMLSITVLWPLSRLLGVPFGGPTDPPLEVALWPIAGSLLNVMAGALLSSIYVAFQTTVVTLAYRQWSGMESAAGADMQPVTAGALPPVVITPAQ